MGQHHHHFRFRWRKLLQHLLKLCRELLIGKAAAVILAWVLKNALYLTIILMDAKWVHGLSNVSVDQITNPSWVKEQGLEAAVAGSSLTTFVLLLLVAAFLAWSFKQTSFTGFFHVHEVDGADGDDESASVLASSALTAVLRSSTTQQTFSDLQQFYIGGIAFIPAWAYKDLVNKAVLFATEWYMDQFMDSIHNATADVKHVLRNVTTAVTEAAEDVAEDLGNSSVGEAIADHAEVISDHAERIVDHVENVTESVVEDVADATEDVVEVFDNATDGLAVRNATEEIVDDVVDHVEDVASEESRNSTNKTVTHHVVHKVQDVLDDVFKKEDVQARILWNVLLAMGFTLVAAGLQIGAHTVVERLEGSGWEFVKQVLNSLQTCMGLGTGFAFWNVLWTTFSGHVDNWWCHSAYAAGVTLCVTLYQGTVRRLMARSEHTECVQKVWEFTEVASNFVIAWAWKGWLNVSAAWLVEMVLGEGSGEKCSDLVELHSGLSGFLITMFGILVVAGVAVFCGAHPDVKKGVNLVAGINIGWAGMDFAISFFACSEDNRGSDLKLVWGAGLLIFLITIIACVLLEYGDHLLDKKIEELRAKAGTLEDDDDGYWKEYSTSSEDESDYGSEEDFEETETATEKEKDDDSSEEVDGRIAR